MQQYGAGSTLYDDTSGYFGRSEAFSIDESGDHTTVTCGSGLLGLDESLDRQFKVSPLREVLPNGESVAAHELSCKPLDFDLDDNGQLLHDMLQQQQQMQHHQAPPSPTQQQSAAAASWEESIHVLQEMLLLQQHPALQCSTDHQSPNLAASMFNHMPPSFPPERAIHGFSTAKFPAESELLSLLQLPRCAANSSMPAGASSCTPDYRKQTTTLGMLPVYNPAAVGETMYLNPPPIYDPHILQQQPSSPYPVSLKHLLQNIPPTLTNQSTTSSLVHHIDVEQKEPALNDEGRQYTSSLFDFKRENALAKGEPRGINHFATERQRREYLNERYQTLRSLVPNPTKADRASIVQDAIEYVKELKRTVQELQLLVQEKRRGGGGIQKRRRVGGESNNQGGVVVADMESSSHPATATATTTGGGRGGGGMATTGGGEGMVGDIGSQLRSSWLQRTSQHGTQVDVRIVDDEVNIKLSQKKRRNCLLDVVAALYELRLDLLHANGANIGEHHIFMLNTKIMEGSSTFAGQVAARLIEVVDRHFNNNYVTGNN